MYMYLLIHKNNFLNIHLARKSKQSAKLCATNYHLLRIGETWCPAYPSEHYEIHAILKFAARYGF